MCAHTQSVFASVFAKESRSDQVPLPFSRACSSQPAILGVQGLYLWLLWSAEL